MLIQAFTSQRVHGGFPYSPIIDGLLVPDFPSRLFARGAFSRVPFISGNNLDEATDFLSSVAYTSINITSTRHFTSWVQSQLPLARCAITDYTWIQGLTDYP